MLPRKRKFNVLNAKQRKQWTSRKPVAKMTTRKYATNTGTSLTRIPRNLNPSWGGPFGQTFETELCYCTPIQLDPGVNGGSVSAIFRANGLFDPEVALGGHQPHGYDQLVAIFNSYQVISSSIEATLFPKTSEPVMLPTGTSPWVLNNNIQGACLSIAVRDNQTSLVGPLTGISNLLERPNFKTKFVSSYDKPTSVKHGFSIKSFYGNARKPDDDTLSGSAGTDPTDQVYYHVILAAPESINLNTQPIVIRIKYKVRFFNPIDLIDIPTYLMSGAPDTRYYLRGGYVGFVPTPSSSGTYYMRYVKKITDLTSYDDTIDLPDGGFYAVKDWMLYRAYQKMNNPSAISYMNAFNNWIATIKNVSISRDQTPTSWSIAPHANV